MGHFQVGIFSIVEVEAVNESDAGAIALAVTRFPLNGMEGPKPLQGTLNNMRYLGAMVTSHLSMSRPVPPGEEADLSSCGKWFDFLEGEDLVVAIDDLWGAIGKEEIDSLSPDTVRIASAVHDRVWHSDFNPA